MRQFMIFKLNRPFVLSLIASIGCQTTVAQNNSSNYNAHAANSIGLFLHYYSGQFGDKQPAWSGMWYSRQNLSVVAHLPTRTEFFIYVRPPRNKNSGATNNLDLIFKQIEEKSGSTTTEKTWETISQNVSVKGKSSKVNSYYLRSEFIGTRFDTDRYSKSDRVTTVIYAACLTPESPPSKALYSVAIAMIPLSVPEKEKERLLGVLDNFLREKITYFHLE
jgi:hypothetical protein